MNATLNDFVQWRIKEAFRYHGYIDGATLLKEAKQRVGFVGNAAMTEAMRAAGYSWSKNGVYMSREYVEEQQYQAREARREYWRGWRRTLIVIGCIGLAFSTWYTGAGWLMEGDPFLIWREMAR